MSVGYVVAVVVLVVLSRTVRLLWWNFRARREWERLERLTRADTPRRAPRQWVEVEWPHDNEDDPRPTRREWDRAEGRRVAIEWPDEDDERRY
jgi:hypothetical protein